MMVCERPSRSEVVASPADRCLPRLRQFPAEPYHPNSLLFICHSVLILYNSLLFICHSVLTLLFICHSVLTPIAA